MAFAPGDARRLPAAQVSSVLDRSLGFEGFGLLGLYMVSGCNRRFELFGLGIGSGFRVILYDGYSYI